jgi:hypothetical protein
MDAGKVGDRRQVLDRAGAADLFGTRTHCAQAINLEGIGLALEVQDALAPSIADQRDVVDLAAKLGGLSTLLEQRSSQIAVVGLVCLADNRSRRDKALSFRAYSNMARNPLKSNIATKGGMLE